MHDMMLLLIVMHVMSIPDTTTRSSNIVGSIKTYRNVDEQECVSDLLRYGKGNSRTVQIGESETPNMRAIYMVNEILLPLLRIRTCFRAFGQKYPSELISSEGSDKQ